MFEEDPSVPHKLRALWAMHVINCDSQGFLLRQLHHESEYVRGWSVQFLLEDKNPDATVQTALPQSAAHESSPFVRLNLASGLQRMPLAERWPIGTSLGAHAEDSEDHSLPLMLWYGIEQAAAADPARGLEYAENCQIAKVRRFVVRRIGDAALVVKSLATVIDRKSADAASNAAVEYDLLAGLHDALRGRRHEPLPPGWPAVYAKLSQSTLPGVRAEADALASVFDDPAALVALKRVAGDPLAEVARRQDALSALIEVHAPDLAGLMQRLLAEPAMRAHALQGLAGYDDPQTAKLILQIYPQLDADEKHDAAIETLSSREPYVIALLDAVENHQIPAGDISVFTARQLRQFKDRTISDKLAKVWGTLRESSADKQQQMAHYKRAAYARVPQARRCVARPANLQPHVHPMPHALWRRRKNRPRSDRLESRPCRLCPTKSDRPQRCGAEAVSNANHSAPGWPVDQRHRPRANGKIAHRANRHPRDHFGHARYRPDSTIENVDDAGAAIR